MRAIVDRVYGVGFCLVWLCAFIAGWVYCINEYGGMLGAGLGWLPAGIGATLVALCWPAIVCMMLMTWLGLN